MPTDSETGLIHQGAASGFGEAQTERVLRKLFWRLYFRGRALQQMRHGRQAKRMMAWGLSLFIYACIGVSVGAMGLLTEASATAVILHASTAFLVVFSLASSAGTFLFNQEEAEILLHRPVTPKALLRAKAWVLAGSAWATGLAFNLGGTVIGCFSKGGSWIFAPVHLFSITLLTVFCAAAVVLMYNLCLRWFGRERLDSLMATSQTIMMIIIIAGPQLLPRLIPFGEVRKMSMKEAWPWLAPTSWFAAIDAVALAPVRNAWLWLPAGLAIVATLLACWLAFNNLVADYGEGLTMLNESSGRRPGRRQRRWLGMLLRFPPIAWWLREPAERSAFLLTAAYLMRDRETKTRVYPALAPMAVLVILAAMGYGRASDAGFGMAARILPASAYLAILPMTAMDCLRRSEHWRAADLFRFTPLAHWTPLFEGARKAVILFLLAPVMAALLGITALVSRSSTVLLLFLPSMMLFPALTMTPGLLGMWLPLSAPYDQMTQGVMGCAKMFVFFAVSAAVCGLGLWAWNRGWFLQMLIVEAIVVAALMVLLRYLIGKMAWEEEGS